MRLLSLPLQATLSRWIGPAPVPKWALVKATASVSMIMHHIWRSKCAPATVPQNIGTLTGISQLSTHHSSIRTSPGVITHSTPQVTYTNLHSAFICNVSSCKSQLAICTWSWKVISGVRLNWFVHDSNIKSHFQHIILLQVHLAYEPWTCHELHKLVFEVKKT